MAQKLTLINEQLLASQAKNGDSQAFSKLVEHFTPRLRYFLLKRMPDRCDVEDAIQETFLKVHLNIGSYNESYRFSCWLYTIAARAAVNLARRPRPMAADGLERAEADEMSPYEQACRKDQADNIWKIAATLEPKQYMAVYLKYSEGFTTQEIAAALGISAINVRVQLHRARAVLMKKLKAYQKQGV